MMSRWGVMTGKQVVHVRLKSLQSSIQKIQFKEKNKNSEKD